MDLQIQDNFPGMASYEFNSSPEKISYGDIKFKHFHAREVYINGKQKGEFHLKTKKSPEGMVVFLQSYFPGCSIGLIDPSGLLNLEYSIYLVCKSNPMIMESIQQIFEKVDGDIDGTIP